ncbi:flagellar biosynthesis anti-sigma factor FlgM [Candidatus Riflebacteria bacterium]
MVDKISGPPVPPGPINKNLPAKQTAEDNKFRKVINGKVNKSQETSKSGGTRRSQASKNTGNVKESFFYLKPENREEKIARIKQAIKAGKYSVSVTDVADKLLKIAKDPQLVRLFALKDESRLKKQEQRLLPKLNKEQKSHYLEIVKKVEGDVNLDNEDMRFIRDIRKLLKEQVF